MAHLCKCKTIFGFPVVPLVKNISSGSLLLVLPCKSYGVTTLARASAIRVCLIDYRNNCFWLHVNDFSISQICLCNYLSKGRLTTRRICCKGAQVIGVKVSSLIYRDWMPRNMWRTAWKQTRAYNHYVPDLGTLGNCLSNFGDLIIYCWEAFL